MCFLSDNIVIKELRVVLNIYLLVLSYSIYESESLVSSFHVLKEWYYILTYSGLFGMRVIYIYIG